MPIDTCPKCGEQSLLIVCNVVAEYSIVNTEDSQYWELKEIIDNSAEVLYIRCSSCDAEFHNVTEDENGHIIGLE